VPTLPRARHVRQRVGTGRDLVRRARQHRADLVAIRTGDALQTRAADLPAAIGPVLVGGATALHPDIPGLLEARLRPGAAIVADNANHGPDYLARGRDPASGYLALPFGPDVELSVRLAGCRECMQKSHCGQRQYQFAYSPYALNAYPAGGLRL
jgi:hypothetical protein